MRIRRLASPLLTVFSTVILGGLLGATLVRLSPGFRTDERELDSRLSEESIQSLREAREGESNVLRFYVQYLADLFRGHLGVSRSLGQPVAELLADRIPVTFRLVGIGLMFAWGLGFAFALPATGLKSPIYEVASTALSGLLICLPAGVMALIFFIIEGPSSLAIGLVVFPKVFRYLRNVFTSASMLPHIVAAKARGLGRTRVLFWHLIPSVIPQVLTLAGISVSLAFGAAIPIEVICDAPGVGQLVWQAALGRDLPLLVNLTLLICVITLLANFVSDVCVMYCTSQQQ
jgi:peptide/nickel transport system permease protein